MGVACPENSFWKLGNYADHCLMQGPKREVSLKSKFEHVGGSGKKCKE